MLKYLEVSMTNTVNNSEVVPFRPIEVEADPSVCCEPTQGHQYNSENIECLLKSKAAGGQLPKHVYLVILDYCHESYFGVCEDEALQFKRGDLVLAKTKYGADVIRIAGEITERPLNLDEKDTTCIKRLANDSEIKKCEDNARRRAQALKIFNEKITRNNLKMKAVTAHFLAAEPKVIFFFTADTRIDFRKLVKDLVAEFKIRVELRQIAVRDESRIAGGLGQCGRPFCCSYITDRLPSVSTKMAREQGFSLSTQKSSGQCGRLLCCLAFEHNLYLKDAQKIPPVGFRFQAGDENYIITDVDRAAQQVTVADSQQRTDTVSTSRFSFIGGTWQADEAFFETLAGNH